MVILAFMTVIGLFAPVIAPFDPYEIHATGPTCGVPFAPTVAISPSCRPPARYRRA